jgi:hypothetical protein
MSFRAERDRAEEVHVRAAQHGLGRALDFHELAPQRASVRDRDPHLIARAVRRVGRVAGVPQAAARQHAVRRTWRRWTGHRFWLPLDE